MEYVYATIIVVGGAAALLGYIFWTAAAINEGDFEPHPVWWSWPLWAWVHGILLGLFILGAGGLLIWAVARELA